jgi:hypothetical protein
MGRALAKPIIWPRAKLMGFAETVIGPDRLALPNLRPTRFSSRERGIRVAKRQLCDGYLMALLSRELGVSDFLA